LQTVRYMKHTCTLAELHIVARKYKSEKAPILMLECMISQLYLKLVYSQYILNWHHLEIINLSTNF
jgi:hypothetical protein